VSREKAPIYTLGSPDVRSFSRNKRGIAGSLIWVNFDRHAFLGLVQKMRGKFIANVDDIRPQFRTEENAFLSQNAIFTRCFAVASKNPRARERVGSAGGLSTGNRACWWKVVSHKTAVSGGRYACVTIIRVRTYATPGGKKEGLIL
jgi:hypothetical protein